MSTVSDDGALNSLFLSKGRSARDTLEFKVQSLFVAAYNAMRLKPLNNLNLSIDRWQD
ncbi:MAG: hypothetical protein PVF65_12005 [Sphingomonadales bacterium]|jgi:hypothetical protein